MCLYIGCLNLSQNCMLYSKNLFVNNVSITCNTLLRICFSEIFLFLFVPFRFSSLISPFFLCQLISGVLNAKNVILGPPILS